MTYGSFLKACRLLAGVENKSEFARKLNFKKPGHYIGAENGKRKPGRELLEAAAKLAGIEFEDCIQLPVKLPLPPADQRALAEFKQALFDSRHDTALFAVKQLRSLKPPASRRPHKPK